MKVALIGLDGSGKSANITKLKEDKDFRNFYFIWSRWKPTLLRPAYAILNKKMGSKSDNCTESQLGKEYNNKKVIKNKLFKNSIIRGIWMFIALIDYFFQFHAKTYKLTVKKKNIIFDRFYLDLFIDQGINFSYTPQKIAKLIKRKSYLFPKINKTIYIHVKPEVCLSRKDDIPNMDYLNRRYIIYEYLSKEFKWIVVNGEEDFSEVNRSIKRLILEDLGDVKK